AGHALMGYILQPDKLDSASITSQGGTLGSVRMNGDDVGLASKSEIEQRIMISLAGMCAEELMAGEMSTGNSSDIKRSVDLVKTMLDEGFYGMGYVAISAGNSPWESETCNEQFAIQMVKIKEILDRMKKRVETILAINKDILESIATALVDKGELRKSEIIELARDYQKVA
ncbi:MAG: hypothetical protein J6R44_03725, partial [Clostridia bacterium]|nr:hypothetical protein [Clostridia bacterium]